MRMTFGGQSGNAPAGSPPFLCVQSLCRVMFLPLLGKFWAAWKFGAGKEGEARWGNTWKGKQLWFH